MLITSFGVPISIPVTLIIFILLLLLIQPLFWFTVWSPFIWTIVIFFFLAFHIRLFTNYSLFKTQWSRLITQTPSIHHFMPILQKLHWLPIKHPISYKIILFNFKTVHNLAPSYLSCLLHNAKPVLTFRSSSSIHFTVPSACLVTMGSRAFSHSAPQLWNLFPPDLCNTNSLLHFKSKPKTQLFKKGYSLWF